jgi:hypothetical protein
MEGEVEDIEQLESSNDSEHNHEGLEDGLQSHSRKRRQTSFVHSWMKKDGDFFVCEVKVVHDRNCGFRAKRAHFKSGKTTFSTSAAKRHLLEAHKINEATSLPGKPRQSKLVFKSGAPVRSDQSAVQWSVRDPRTQAVRQDFAKWFILDGLPPHCVEKPGFKDFCRSRFPEFPPPSEKTISAYIPRGVQGFVAWVKANSVMVFSHFSLTTDGWTSDAKEHYRTVTLHFFKPNSSEMRALTLATRLCGGDAEAVAIFIKDALLRFGLGVNQCVGVTTDNANAEIRGVNLAGLSRIPCICHLLDLSMRLTTSEGKNGVRIQHAPSPVYDDFRKLFALISKIHNTPTILSSLREMLEENRILMQAAKASSIPVKPNNTRWNSAFYAAQSCVGIRATLDALVDRFQGDYALEVLTEDNWRCINQCLTFLRPFKEFSKYKEGENYVTNSELLFRLWEACYTAFYSNPFDDEALDYRVRDLKQQIRCDIGERLHACCNLELLWAGIALHPTFKGLSVPDDIHQNFMNENGGRSIPNFFKNAKRRMKESLSAMLDKFGVARLVVEEPVPAFTFNEKLVGNFIPQARQTVHQEAVDWVDERPVPVKSAAEYWSGRLSELGSLARIILTLQASAASSERNWSAADDLSGGDRTNMDPETLDSVLLLKKNVPVIAELHGVSVGEAFDMLFRLAGPYD